MSVEELTRKIRESIRTDSKAEKVAALRKANIIGADGYLSNTLFSNETVEADKRKGNPARF